MSVPADTLRTHLDYTSWASLQLLNAAGRLTEEELARDFQTADRSVLGTLVHIFAADRVWLARVAARPITQFVTEADYDLRVIQREWPALLEEWRRWAAGLTDEDVRQSLRYSDQRGRQWNQPLWKVILHVVNHATHHRGQAAGFLRSMGHTPPTLDLIYYYREKG